MTWPCNGKMLTRGRVDIGLFPVGLMTCGQPNCSRNHPKRGDLFELWVWRLLRTKCHVLILLFSEVSGKITFQWLGPGVSWRLPPPPPLPSVIFLARQGCYPKLELKSVVELCCHVFDIISLQHSCTVDRCMDCNLLSLHYMSHIPSAITTISNMHAPTHWICGSCDGWITCETCRWNILISVIAVAILSLLSHFNGMGDPQNGINYWFDSGHHNPQLRCP